MRCGVRARRRPRSSRHRSSGSSPRCSSRARPCDARVLRRDRSVLFPGLELAIQRQQRRRWNRERLRRGVLVCAGSRRRRAGTPAHRPRSRNARCTARETAASIGSGRPAAAAAPSEVADLDREHAALRFDHGRAAEQRCDARAVERGRHRQHRDRAHVLLRVERQREAGIRVQAALVLLVEQHGRDSGRAPGLRATCG